MKMVFTLKFVVFYILVIKCSYLHREPLLKSKIEDTIARQVALKNLRRLPRTFHDCPYYWIIVT